MALLGPLVISGLWDFLGRWAVTRIGMSSGLGHLIASMTPSVGPSPLPQTVAVWSAGVPELGRCEAETPAEPKMDIWCAQEANLCCFKPQISNPGWYNDSNQISWRSNKSETLRSYLGWGVMPYSLLHGIILRGTNLFAISSSDCPPTWTWTDHMGPRLQFTPCFICVRFSPWRSITMDVRIY